MSADYFFFFWADANRWICSVKITRCSPKREKKKIYTIRVVDIRRHFCERQAVAVHCSVVAAELWCHYPFANFVTFHWSNARTFMNWMNRSGAIRRKRIFSTREFIFFALRKTTLREFSENCHSGKLGHRCRFSTLAQLFFNSERTHKRIHGFIDVLVKCQKIVTTVAAHSSHGRCLGGDRYWMSSRHNCTTVFAIRRILNRSDR